MKKYKEKCILDALKLKDQKAIYKRYKEYLFKEAPIRINKKIKEITFEDFKDIFYCHSGRGGLMIEFPVLFK